jgi:hypothetical protein
MTEGKVARRPGPRGWQAMIQSRQVVYKGVDYRNYVMPSFLPPINRGEILREAYVAPLGMSMGTCAPPLRAAPSPSSPGLMFSLGR